MSHPAPGSDASDEAVSTADVGDGPSLTLHDPDDDIVAMLRAGQLLLLKHPIAARAALRAFVAEGRRFAQTEEGVDWKRRIERSPLLRRARIVWEGASLNMLEDGHTSLLPSALLESLLAAAASVHLENLLSRLFMERESDEGPAPR